MSKKQIVFLGSKAIGAFCIQHLIENSSRYNVEVVAVVTKQNPSLDIKVSVQQLALEADISLYDSVTDIPACDFIISVQHHEILTAHDIAKANEIAVNLHMAPLPEYRGCNQFSYAIIDGKSEFGATLHKMSTGIDDGDIIAERRFAIHKDIWVDELYDQTVEESKLLFTESIKEIFSGTYTLTPQSDLIAARGTTYHYRDEIKDLKIIQEEWSEEKKKLHLRATFKEGFEPPYSIIEGEKKYYNKNSF